MTNEKPLHQVFTHLFSQDHNNFTLRMEAPELNSAPLWAVQAKNSWTLFTRNAERQFTHTSHSAKHSVKWKNDPNFSFPPYLAFFSIRYILMYSLKYVTNMIELQKKN